MLKLHRPLIGVASCYNAAAPRNIALMREARSVKMGVAPGHATPREFRAIAATGGTAMGGLCSSLRLRQSMADSLGLTIRGHAYDVGPAGCDESMMLALALLRLSVSPIFIYGGSIVSGTGGKVMELIAAIIRPRDIVTRRLLKNAAAVFAACGDNAAALHLRGIAHELGLFNMAEIFKKTPYVADLKPAGRYVAKDMFEARGVPLLMKTLLDHSHLHGDCLTVTGRTIADNLKSVKFNPHQDMVRSTDKPITATGGVVALKGNLAPKGAIVTVAGMSNLRFISPARCLEAGEDEAVPTAPPTGQGAGGKIAPITNGRFSGATRPFCVGPEAAGPIGLLRDGDVMGIDAVAGTLNVKLNDSELARSRSRWLPGATNHTSEGLSKYAQKVGQAGGAVTHPEGAYEKQCHANI